MMPFSLFLALKYLRPKRSLVSVVTAISVLGVALGVAILVIVLSIMTGFDDLWKDKILSFTAHVTVIKQGGLVNDEELGPVLKKAPGVTDVAAHVQTIVLIQNGKSISAPFAVGIPDERSGIMSEIPGKIKSGAFDVTEGNMVVGRDLAIQMGLEVGDKVLVYSPKCVMAKDEIHLPDELTVAGIYELGMWEFDSNYVLVSLDTARDLYGIERGAMAMRVTTRDPMKAFQTADTVAAMLNRNISEDESPYIALTWMDMNKTLFDTLRVEKGMMFFVLAMVTIVAMFCVTVTLIVMGVQKTREIGILKALGFPPFRIMGVFIWHGWIQCLGGMFMGLGAGMFLIQYRNEVVRWLSYRLNIELFPKSIYLLSEIPARTMWSDVAEVFLLVWICCTIASLVPAIRAAFMRPVDALRQE